MPLMEIGAHASWNDEICNITSIEATQKPSFMAKFASSSLINEEVVVHIEACENRVVYSLVKCIVSLSSLDSQVIHFLFCICVLLHCLCDGIDVLPLRYSTLTRKLLVQLLRHQNCRHQGWRLR
ncbi:hypothetical protein P8452_28419 [Trifolium repens]|nr:hypothetical protein P8452_28419 [Trifolium repens]